MEGFMKLTAVVAIVLISACMALAQQIKEPGKSLPGMKAHSTVAPPPVTKSSSDQLAKIEQQTARVVATKPVVHHSSAVAATPALDLGKNKPIRSARSPQPGLPNGH
jgi:type IV secretory pathway VirJ component